MRKYEPIWNALKDTFIVSIEAAPEKHPLIIQSVRREKCKDLNWKLLCTEEGNLYKLKHTISGAKLTFYLEVDTSIKNL